MARWLWHRTGAGLCFSSDGDVCFSPAGERRGNRRTRQSDVHDFAVGSAVAVVFNFSVVVFFNSSFKFFMHKVMESQRSLKKKGGEEILMSWEHISGRGCGRSRP